jgi:two-component system, NtrC family, response regulator HydG
MKSHPIASLSDNENVKRLLDYLKISYWRVDMNFVLLDVNDTFLNLTGAVRGKLIGRDMRTLITPEERAKVEELIGELSRDKASIQFELYVYGRKHMEKIPVLFHLSVNLDAAGQPDTADVLLVDVSGQKKIRDDLEKEKKMLQTILFGIRDCVTIFDEQGRFMLGNPESRVLHGGRKTPLLPLETSGPTRLALEVNKHLRQFIGEVRPIYDHEGRLFAYAETLTDITNQVRLKERERELFHFRRQMRRRELQTEMIGASKKIQGVLDTILRCAEVDSSVLVTGETGVGKEVAARAIHAQSRRRDNPFVSVSCGALPESLLESELFGHVKGAFTGAISNRGGLFREAHGGTLFLDEIGEMTKGMQVKLLQVLQDKEVRPVGADRSYPVDVRIICATNRDLAGMTRSGEFRLDLYYRIAVIPLWIPPLRERQEDIFRLVDHFIRKHQKNDRRRLKHIDLPSRQLLCRYVWPGNIRELENAVEHALAMCRGELITPECFPPRILEPDVTGAAPPSAASPAGRTARREHERQAVAEALERHGGNQSAAARDLGMSRVTLWRKKTMFNL